MGPKGKGTTAVSRQIRWQGTEAGASDGAIEPHSLTVNVRDRLTGTVLSSTAYLPMGKPRGTRDDKDTVQQPIQEDSLHTTGTQILPLRGKITSPRAEFKCVETRTKSHLCRDTFGMKESNSFSNFTCSSGLKFHINYLQGHLDVNL